MPLIRRLSRVEEPVASSLCRLLLDVVHDGASVGFLAPLAEDRARRYWEEVSSSLVQDQVLWVAESGNDVVGSVQLGLCTKENARHRAEVQKLIVLRSQRGRGIASALLKTAEAFAAAHGRSLLVLDTIAGSLAESVYQHLGWQRVGEIPDFAAMPAGELRPTVYYYKRTLPVSAAEDR